MVFFTNTLVWPLGIKATPLLRICLGVSASGEVTKLVFCFPNLITPNSLASIITTAASVA